MSYLLDLIQKINNDWKPILLEETTKSYFKELEQKLQQSSVKTFPPADQIFRVFQACSVKKVKVVILGQDPYHGEGQANGMSFSVNKGIAIPPSLKNIYKELHQDLNCPLPSHGDLSAWLAQGVFLLNASLSVEMGIANAHAKMGWTHFLQRILEVLNEENLHLVFILWGKNAQKQRRWIDESKHLIIESPHPSPLGAYRGFFGSKPFSKSNDYLRKHELTEINWCIK